MDEDERRKVSMERSMEFCYVPDVWVRRIDYSVHRLLILSCLLLRWIFEWTVDVLFNTTKFICCDR